MNKYTICFVSTGNITIEAETKEEALTIFKTLSYYTIDDFHSDPAIICVVDGSEVIDIRRDDIEQDE